MLIREKLARSNDLKICDILFSLYIIKIRRRSRHCFKVFAARSVTRFDHNRVRFSKLVPLTNAHVIHLYPSSRQGVQF